MATPQNISPEEKLVKAKSFKAEGNEKFKNKDYRGAIGKYHRAILYLKGIESTQKGLQGLVPENAPLPPDLVKEKNSLKIDCYNNLAACILKSDNPNNEKVVSHCDAVLEIESSNVKALYRKGVGLYNLEKVEEALSVLQKAQNVPSKTTDPSIRKQMELCYKKLSVQDQQLKRTYKKMFSHGDSVTQETSNGNTKDCIT